MRTLCLPLVGPVILVLLGGMGGAAMAQEADAPALWVTGPEPRRPARSETWRRSSRTADQRASGPVDHLHR